MASNAPYPKRRGAPLHEAMAVGAVLTALLWCRPSPASSEGGCLIDPGSSILTVGNRTFTPLDGNRLAEVSSSTALCMSCHDGTVASSLMTTEPAPGVYRTDKSHPVDVPYPVDSPDFVPIVLLNKALKLEGGLVTCRTCHTEGTSGITLSVPIYESRLCLSCHKK